MTYKHIKQEFEKAFPDAHFCANDGDAGTQELLAFIFDLVNDNMSDTKSAGMSFQPMAMTA
jgi:hypothetical protein